jgi:hypothetical protein
MRETEDKRRDSLMPYPNDLDAWMNDLGVWHRPRRGSAHEIGTEEGKDPAQSGRPYRQLEERVRSDGSHHQAALRRRGHTLEES